MSAFPRVYRSFADFERAELRKMDHIYGSVDEMVDELLRAEIDEELVGDSSGILFDDPEDFRDDY